MFDPPFNKEHSIFTFPVDGISNNVLSPPPESLTPSSTLSLNSHGIALGLPAFFYGGNSLQKLHSADPTILKSYFRAELDVCRLNRIHKHLWIAGQERPARALHHQTLIGRRVIVTEDPSLHLLWIDASLFVKPLPDFILCHDAWESIRVEQNLFEGAVGMLLSYIWLVRTKSDLRCVMHSSYTLFPLQRLCTISSNAVDLPKRLTLNPM